MSVTGPSESLIAAFPRLCPSSQTAINNPIPPHDSGEAVCVGETKREPWTADNCSAVSGTVIVTLLRKHGAKE
jgi:hypothetical protein